MTTFSTGRWLGTGPNITVVDTPGFKDTDDAEFIDEIMNVLGDEVREVLDDVFGSNYFAGGLIK